MMTQSRGKVVMRGGSAFGKFNKDGPTVPEFDIKTTGRIPKHHDL
jgi:hypothetical protein